ncbi:MAG TPA: DinB family protein [Mycobacteriales bacterium]|jgi:uncharacterized damage-inducible protein DinB
MTDQQTPEPEFPDASNRTDPPFVAAERPMLESWLEFHRATLLVKCEGLSDDQLRDRSVPPSSLSLLGLVRHMTEVERNWFRRVLLDEDVARLYWSDDNLDGDFDDVDTADVAADLAIFRAELDHVRAVGEAHPDLDAVGARKRRGNGVTLRWIYIHMIEEYARHNGHADFLRERIDGATGD